MMHTLGLESHVSLAILVRFLLAGTTEIWDHVCGPFWPIFVFSDIFGQVGNTILHRARDLALIEWQFL